MKQKIFVTIIFLFSALSSQAKWELMTESSEKGVTPFGVKTILNNWEYDHLFDWERKNMANTILAGEMVNPISEIEVYKKEYQWVGPTKCQPGDPKLFHTSLSYTVCYQNGDPSIGGICVGMSSGIIGSDPCEFDDIKLPIPLKLKRTPLINVTTLP